MRLNLWSDKRTFPNGFLLAIDKITAHEESPSMAKSRLPSLL